MEILTVLLVVFHLVTCRQTPNDLKVEYFVKAINNALEAAEEYEPRKNNSDLLASDENASPKDFGEFDFIIVGSGSSGSAFAAKMSEIEEFKILLLEAGDYDDDLTKIPYLSTLFQKSDRNWGYFSSPQKNACLGWVYNQCSFPRGKILGGSSAIDGVDYIRGNKADFDGWASLGNPGWSFKEVLPFFKKFENFQSTKIDLKYRGFAGPVDIAYRMPKLNISFIYDAFRELGVDAIEDYNAEKQIGVSEIQGLTNFGEKVSGSSAFVRPTFTRLNYNLILKAFVTKILINKSTKTAYGVQFVKDGMTYRATARKEVILSSGIVNTPQLLMLSGIGPAKELAKHKIPVVANLPVGTMFRGNVFFDMYFTINLTSPIDTLEGAVRKFLKGQGILTSFQNGVSVNFYNTQNNRSSLPNVLIIYHRSSSITEKIPSLTNYIPEVQKFEDKLNLSQVIFTRISLLHPQSNGNITLKSNNPSDFPNLNLGIFDKIADLEVLYEGVQRIKTIINTKAIKMFNVSTIKYDFCDSYKYDSKDYWYCAIRHLAQPGYQWAGSTKMGPINDPYAVVDYKLRVHGIKKLRIVDRSAIPVTLSGNYNPSALMMGEKAADMIKKEYGCVPKNCIPWEMHT